MSKERGGGHQSSSQQGGTEEAQSTRSTPLRGVPRLEDEFQTASETSSSGIPSPGTPTEEQKPSAVTSRSSQRGPSGESGDENPRQVIAVSASKGPAAFFNLARKFLVTDETCDLSALEGAIVSAVDAAHLLERSKLATIVRVQTSYVTVEPKRRKQQQATGADESQRQQGDAGGSAGGALSQATSVEQSGEISTMLSRSRSSSSSANRELRRARIVITVKRTESYERWLEENPLQAILAGDGDDDEGEPGDGRGIPVVT